MSVSISQHRNELATKADLANHLLDAIDRKQSGPDMATSLLLDAIGSRASDVHIDPAGEHYRVRFRIDGMLVDAAMIEIVDGKRLINQFRVLCDVSPNEVDQSESRWTGEVDGKELDIRCTHIATVAGDKLCVRLMGQNHVPADLDSIVVDEDDRHLLRSFLSRRQGMLIVVGPTGSGKSTLLFGLASEVDRPDSSVVTLEDPVERRCPTMTQIEVDANGDDMSFADGVKLSLRLDPDSLVVGETRGFDSARAAVAASNSGRSLMTSMHGDCHATAIDNLRSWGIKDREIATTVRCVVAARLIRQLCDECKATRPAHPSDQQWLQNQGVSETSELTYPVGCDRCMQTGYFGRMPLHRVWQLNPKQSQMIRTGHDAREIVPDETSFQAPAIAAVMSGDTSVETIRAAGLGI